MDRRLCVMVFIFGSVTAIEWRGNSTAENATACIGETIQLYCPEAEVVVSDDVIKGRSNEYACSHNRHDCTDGMWYDTSCFWRQKSCQVEVRSDADRIIKVCSDGSKMATYFTVLNFMCINESVVAEMCIEEEGASQTLQSHEGHIISPYYPAAFPSGDACHLTLLPPPDYQDTLFSIYSIEFHTYSTSNCQNSSQYVCITVYLINGQTKDLYYCGNDNYMINISYVATKIEITFKRDSIGGANLPGFRLRYTAENVTAELPEDTTIVEEETTTTTTTAFETTTVTNRSQTVQIVVITLFVTFFAALVLMIFFMVYKPWNTKVRKQSLDSCSGSELEPDGIPF